MNVIAYQIMNFTHWPESHFPGLNCQYRALYHRYREYLNDFQLDVVSKVLCVRP